MKGKTKIGRLLQKIGNVGKPILEVLSETPVPGARLLGRVADMIKTSDEIDEEQKKELLDAVRIDLQDLANARKHGAEIQKSQFSSWMAKNIPYIIDVFILLIWGGLTFYIVVAAIKLVNAEDVDFPVILGIYSGVTALATQVVSFHRGSSAGSRLKDIMKQNI